MLEEDITHIFLSGIQPSISEADIINAIAKHIRVFEIIKYQDEPDIESLFENNSFALRVSKFPDDIEGLRWVVSVLPGVNNQPVRASEGDKIKFEEIKKR